MPSIHTLMHAYTIMQGTLLTLFPLHFFFIFLYYTDVGSATFVLLSYLVLPCHTVARLRHLHALAILQAGSAVLGHTVLVE